jgi:haloalkane dehalogenase
VEAYRTPDERFERLPDYSLEPRYLDWEGLRLHYTDEGEGPPVMLFHGEPTWGFLYRKVGAALQSAGYRTIAADQPGFGRSDKPTDPSFYTYDNHTRAAAALAEHLGLEGAAAVVQDWGGPIGLRVAVENRGRFGRLVILNTGLFTGRVTPGFAKWRAFVERTPDLPVGKVMERSMVRAWPAEVIAAYEAPFPEPAAKVGAHRFPLIVPTTPDAPGAAEMRLVRDGLAGWAEPALVLFSTADPIFPPAVGARLAELIPGAGLLQTIERAGHFLQEDAGEEVGEMIAEFLRATD